MPHNHINFSRDNRKSDNDTRSTRIKRKTSNPQDIRSERTNIELVNHSAAKTEEQTSSHNTDLIIVAIEDRSLIDPDYYALLSPDMK